MRSSSSIYIHILYLYCYGKWLFAKRQYEIKASIKIQSYFFHFSFRAKGSFSEIQSQGMSSSCFPTKKLGLRLADLAGLPIWAYFFGGKPLELISWPESHKKLTSLLFSSHECLFAFELNCLFPFLPPVPSSTDWIWLVPSKEMGSAKRRKKVF